MNNRLLLIPLLLILLVGVVSATDIDNFTRPNKDPITGYNSW